MEPGSPRGIINAGDTAISTRASVRSAHKIHPWSLNEVQLLAASVAALPGQQRSFESDYQVVEVPRPAA
jgi:hypothetical protein